MSGGDDWDEGRADEAAGDGGPDDEHPDEERSDDDEERHAVEFDESEAFEDTGEFGAPDESGAADADDADANDADPDVEVDVDPALGPGEEGAFADPDVEDPFAELDAGATSDAATGDAEGDPFEEMEVEDLGEDVWDALAEEETEASVGPISAAGDEAPGVESVEREDAERPDHIVDKRQYCQSCPYFAEPPTVACEHEGTEIVEVVDADEFRVRGCPMIAEEGPQFDRG